MVDRAIRLSVHHWTWQFRVPEILDWAEAHVRDSPCCTFRGWTIGRPTISVASPLIQASGPFTQRCFRLLCVEWGTPDMDLLASRFNKKVDRFVSLDPLANATDALAAPWGAYHLMYAFPPV